MGLLSKLFGGNRADMSDAARIYAHVMKQSRRPEFFGDGRFADDYDGRIDLLALNLSLIMKRARDSGENGKILSQAIFDTLRDDFEVALREEGLSDKGVAKRIKPMVKLFFDRMKSYDEAVDAGALRQKLAENLGQEPDSPFAAQISSYALSFFDGLKPLALGDIARAKFSFPKL